MNKKILVVLILISVSFIYVVYGYIISKKVSISKYVIESNKIPDNFNDKKILQISDMHNINNKKEILKNIYEIKPEYIVLTGDMINYDTKENEHIYILDIIKELNNEIPIYYIKGNHELKLQQNDYKKNTNVYNDFEKMLLKNNVIIVNEKIQLTEENDSIYLYGLQEDTTDYLKKNSNKTSNQISLNKQEFNILLAHNPLKFELYEKMGFDLVLSGHVHGGEIRLPLLGGILSPTRTLFPKYTKGEYVLNNTKMIVSSGLGDRTFKLRVNNPYDLVVIQLKKI